jgi:hypothetical protein
MTVANDNLPPVGALQLLSQMKPAELRAELAEYKRRYNFAPTQIFGSVEERDEWTTLLLAGMCFGYSVNEPAAVGFVSMVESQPQAGFVMLLKRIYLQTPAASQVSILRHGAGFQGGGIQASSGYNLQDTALQVTDAGSKQSASNNLAGGPFGTVPIFNAIPTQAGVVQVIEIPGAFLAAIGPGDALQVVNLTANQALWVTLQWATVPLGGY